MKLYFTYGSWEKFPHKNGYMVVEGVDFRDCIETYRSKYPDVNENCLNCSDYYNEEQWVRVGEHYKAQKPKEILVSELAQKLNRMSVLLETAIELATDGIVKDSDTKQWLLTQLGTTVEELEKLGVNTQAVKVIKIDSISMKEIMDDDIYFRMWVKATELPEWIYLKAKEMDKECDYLKRRDNQLFEIEGYLSSLNNKANGLKVVYFWDDYEIITELDKKTYDYIYEAFEEFASKYGHRMPDNGELGLGDSEYENQIPQDLKDEWENDERR